MAKSVFDTDEIAHLWAHKTQTYARNKGGNFYFEGDTIYSYGRHFPIARHLNGRKRCVFFTSRGYSSTTSKHIYMVRKALPANVPVFVVHEPDQSPSEGLKYHRERVKNYLLDLGCATKRQQPKRYTTLMDAIDAAKEFCVFFGYSTKFCELPADMEAAYGVASEYNEKLDKQRRNAEARRVKAAKLAREKWERETLPELIQKFRSGSRYAYEFRDCPTMLRVSEETGPDSGEPRTFVVETSRGVRFPAEHALRVLSVVEKILNSGGTWESNGHTIHLGHYQLESIDADGTVHAGCHHVAKDEVLRLIAELRQLKVNNLI